MDWAADLIALSDAVKVDLKALDFRWGGGDFRLAGDTEKLGRGGSSFSISIKGCSCMQLSDLASCLTLGIEPSFEIEGEGLALSAELKSSGHGREGIDSVDMDRVVSIPASSPLLPTIISPSTSPSMYPNRPSNGAVPTLFDKLPLLPDLTPSSRSRLKSDT